MLILEVIWSPKSIKLGVEFGCVFGMFLLSGFKVVLGRFWNTCWCQNDDQKAKGGFVEMLVLRKQYCCFRGLWAPFGVPE